MLTVKSAHIEFIVTIQEEDWFGDMNQKQAADIADQYVAREFPGYPWEREDIELVNYDTVNVHYRRPVSAA